MVRATGNAIMRVWVLSIVVFGMNSQTCLPSEERAAALSAFDSTLEDDVSLVQLRASIKEVKQDGDQNANSCQSSKCNTDFCKHVLPLDDTFDSFLVVPGGGIVPRGGIVYMQSHPATTTQMKGISRVNPQNSKTCTERYDAAALNIKDLHVDFSPKHDSVICSRPQVSTFDKFKAKLGISTPPQTPQEICGVCECMMIPKHPASVVLHEVDLDERQFFQHQHRLPAIDDLDVEWEFCESFAGESVGDFEKEIDQALAAGGQREVAASFKLLDAMQCSRLSKAK